MLWAHLLNQVRHLRPFYPLDSRVCSADVILQSILSTPTITVIVVTTQLTRPAKLFVHCPEVTSVVTLSAEAFVAGVASWFRRWLRRACALAMLALGFRELLNGRLAACPFQLGSVDLGGERGSRISQVMCITVVVGRMNTIIAAVDQWGLDVCERRSVPIRSIWQSFNMLSELVIVQIRRESRKWVVVWVNRVVAIGIGSSGRAIMFERIFCSTVILSLT